MSVDINQHSSLKVSSPARIETLETYEESINEYRELNFTYVPLPMDKKYFNTETREIFELAPQQIIKADASVFTVIEHLRGDDFLLIDFSHEYGYDENGSIQCSAGGDATFDNKAAKCFRKKEFQKEIKKKLKNALEKETALYIFTLADINRRSCKESLYPLVAELENTLVEAIKHEYQDKGQINLIPYLTSKTIERWGNEKRSGLEMHISEFMNLSEILEIVANSENLYTQFGYKSKKKFESETGGLVDFRNAIMHSARTLVHDRDDLCTLVDRIYRCKQILEESGQEVRLRQPGPDPWLSEFPD